MAARRPDLSPVQQVALADDADQTSARIDDWRAADAAFREQRRQGLDRRLRINRDHVGRHHVHRAHCAPPYCSPIDIPRITRARLARARHPWNYDLSYISIAAQPGDWSRSSTGQPEGRCPDGPT